MNKSGTGTPELDEQIAELEKLPTQEEQIQKANELEKEAFKQYGIMPYANGPRLVASKKTLANYGAMAFPCSELDCSGTSRIGSVSSPPSLIWSRSSGL